MNQVSTSIQKGFFKILSYIIWLLMMFCVGFSIHYCEVHNRKNNELPPIDIDKFLLTYLDKSEFVLSNDYDKGFFFYKTYDVSKKNHKNLAYIQTSLEQQGWKMSQESISLDSTTFCLNKNNAISLKNTADDEDVNNIFYNFDGKGIHQCESLFSP